jgi:hypothetical protein
VTVNINVSSPSTVSLTVFTMASKKIFEQTWNVTSNTSISWNLNDSQGGTLANGVYYLRIVVKGSQPLTKILKVMLLR